MMKIVVVLIALLLLVWLILGSTRRRARDTRRDEPAPRRTSPPEGMVACAHCGVHLPGSQALQVGGRVFCSVAHGDAGPRAP